MIGRRGLARVKFDGRNPARSVQGASVGNDDIEGIFVCRGQAVISTLFDWYFMSFVGQHTLQSDGDAGSSSISRILPIALMLSEE